MYEFTDVNFFMFALVIINFQVNMSQFITTVTHHNNQKNIFYSDILS